jgi:hypothetical protein
LTASEIPGYDGFEVSEMATHRSPNYPAHGLSEAVSMVREIYAKEKRSQSPGEIIAKALGYSSLSGNARVKIASLKKYGLLDGDERQGMRVSDLAMQLLYPSNSLEQHDAMKTAALNPTLFRTLSEEKMGASDEAMTNYLVSKLDFSPSGAKQAVEAFRDTMKVSGLETFGYNESEMTGRVEAQLVQTESTAALASPSSEVNTWTWTLSMPRAVKADLRIVGTVTKADILRLKKQIEGLEEAFDEEAE